MHHVDRGLAFVAGEGEALVGGTWRPVAPNPLVFVPSGTCHNFINTGADLEIVTLYAPPQRAPGTVHRAKTDANVAEAAEHSGGNS